MGKEKFPRIVVGQTYGRLTVISKAPKQGRSRMWRCRCLCGKEREVRDQSLKKGTTKSCGCLSRDIVVGRAKERAGDVIGRHINRWLVVDLIPRRSKNGGVYFLCRCDCGNEREVAGDGLLNGKSKSCGSCGIHSKPICKFGHNVSEWGGRTPSGSCKACTKHKSMIRNYGLSLDDYLRLWEFQQGLCAICGKPLNKAITVPGWTEGTGNLGRPEVDHEHGHKEVSRDYVRGILCGGRWAGCNRKLGRIDNLPWLSAAIQYLQSPPARKLFLEEKK